MRRVVDNRKENFTEEVLNEQTRYLEMFNTLKMPYTIDQIEYAIKCYVHYGMTMNMVLSHTGVNPKDLKECLPMYGFKARSRVNRCRHFEGFCVYDSNFNPLGDVGVVKPKA